MIDYPIAKYLELSDYKAPKDVNSIYIRMPDNKRLRLMYWKNNNFKKNNNGTILLQQGHNEFIEKYFETIQEFLNRGFNVVSFDWRGQGLSDKMINNEHKQYVEDFNIHEADLKFIIKEFIDKNFEKPLIGIGHSMGGCIILSFLKKNTQIFEKVILSAPMLGFNNEKFLLPLITLINKFSSDKNYLIGSRPNMGKETPFNNNDLTSDKFRYKRTQALVRKLPVIRLWGVTNGWFRAVKNKLFEIRKKGWAENIKTKILFINNINDRVVSSKHINIMNDRLPNSRVKEFYKTEHEIFMEKDKHRNLMWNEIDNFIKNDL